MFAQFAKTVTAAAAVSLAVVSFAAPSVSASEASFEPFEMAQTAGMQRRQDRRSDRMDDRQDRRGDRQDCRASEGLVGADKRDCKQDERQQRNLNG